MKEMKSVISMIFEASRSSTLWLILLVPLTSLCSLAMPLAL